MSVSNDPFDEMDETLWPAHMRDPLQLDDGTVDRLLDGMPADDAPPSYRGVAELLSTLNAPASADELAPETQTPAKVAAPQQSVTPPSDFEWPARPLPMPTRPRTSSAKRRRSTGQRLRASGAALVGCATLFVGLGAAGALPGAAQGVAADVLATVGVDAPRPDADDPEIHPASSETPEGTVSGTPVSSGTGSTISGTATDGATTGVDKGAAVSSDASNGKSQAGENGQPAAVEGDPQTGGPPITPPGQANDPNGGVGNGKGKGNADHVDGKATGKPEVEQP